MSTDRPRRGRVGDGLFILGLVGRAGSGKSTVGKALAEAGARVIEADRLGHDVTDRDPEVRRALAAEYGHDVYGSDGRLDRKRVAAKVFADPEARHRLDRLVHPKILERIWEILNQHRLDGFRGVVVVDAALMLDWGLERSCDAVVAVVAPESEQVARLVASRGWTEDEARARLEAQRTNEAFAAAADAVLDNRGTPEALAEEARRTVERLQSLRHASTESV